MTGIQPAALLEDELLFAAAHEDAKLAAWTDMHELLALNAELTHSVLRAIIATSGRKPPDQLEIPRPKGARPDSEPLVMRPHEFASHIARSGV